MKIDVEGNEISVVRGMTDTLERIKPKIICEIHYVRGNDVDEILETLGSFGYAVYELSSWVLGDRERLTSLDRAHKIVALPKNRRQSASDRDRSRDDELHPPRHHRELFGTTIMFASGPPAKPQARRERWHRQKQRQEDSSVALSPNLCEVYHLILAIH